MRKLNRKLQDTIVRLSGELDHLDEYKKGHLRMLSVSLHSALRKGVVDIVFICTHNSRRSHMSQIWAQAASYYHGLSFQCYSGGTEATAFYKSAVRAVEGMGFKVSTDQPKASNPLYSVVYSKDAEPIQIFSKEFAESPNPTRDFVAIVNCSRADESCPVIPGASKRLLMIFKDPKSSDGKSEEKETYERKCEEIGREMLYLFEQVNLLKQQ